MARPRRPPSSGRREAARAGAGLDAVGNGALHALEEEQAAEEDQEDGGGAGEELRTGRLAVTGERPAETVNDAGHGIEAVKPAVTLRDQSAGIGDRAGEH